MNIQDRFDAITNCESMCRAGEYATNYYYQEIKNVQLFVPSIFSIEDILNCRKDLETTYIVRIYSEFELTLRDYWENGIGRTSQPRSIDLIISIAGRHFMQADILKHVHLVREYRNSLVHGGLTPPVTLGEARSYLCRFLGSIPRKW